MSELKFYWFRCIGIFAAGMAALFLTAFHPPMFLFGLIIAAVFLSIEEKQEA